MGVVDVSEYTEGSREWAEAMARKGAKVRFAEWRPRSWITFRDGAFFDESGVDFRRWCFNDEPRWSIVGEAPISGPLDAGTITDAAPARDSLPDLAARVAALENLMIPTPPYEGGDLTRLDAAIRGATFTTSRKPLSLVVGGQYRTRGGWRCVVVKEAPDGPLVWHDHKSNFTWWHERDGRMLDDAAFDIIGPWEPEA